MKQRHLRRIRAAHVALRIAHTRPGKPDPLEGLPVAYTIDDPELEAERVRFEAQLLGMIRAQGLLP